MLTRAELRGDDGGSVPILILSPLGVRPEEQNRAIGTALTRAGLALADAHPEPAVIVQGHPGYYPRFGFIRGRTIEVLPPEHLGAIDEAWMVRRRPGAPDDVRGRVVYPQPFLDLDG
jgi:putative acetyltransferase